MMSQKLLVLLLLLNYNSLFSQQKQLPSDTEISILTIGPGNSLNDSFGHNAFRVRTNRMDVVYDYGRFDFNAPNFYLNFARGKLNYFMGQSSFQDFKSFYIWQNRTIKEQSLNLSGEQKNKLYAFLTNNIKPENKFYLYDFFYDNCATKIRDVLNEGINTNINFKTPENLEEKSFRELIQQNLHWNSWGSFGIDLALGSVIDKTAAPYEYMFLPEYINTFSANAEFNGSDIPLVRDSRTIHTGRIKPEIGSFFTSPLFIFGLIGLLIIYITFTDFKKHKRSKWVDILIFAITGILGVLILLLWFATDHQTTAFNYNLLWAFALNVLMVLQTFKSQPKAWFNGYLKFLIIMLCLMVLHWLIGVQRFSLVLIPIVLALLTRYVFLVWYYKSNTKVITDL